MTQSRRKAVEELLAVVLYIPLVLVDLIVRAGQGLSHIPNPAVILGMMKTIAIENIARSNMGFFSRESILNPDRGFNQLVSAEGPYDVVICS
jgi:hypothetical protein